MSVKKKIIHVLTIRQVDTDSKCCFDVLADGLTITEALSFGELVEYLVEVYRESIFARTYTLDYPYLSINK